MDGRKSCLRTAGLQSKESSLKLTSLCCPRFLKKSIIITEIEGRSCWRFSSKLKFHHVSCAWLEPNTVVVFFTAEKQIKTRLVHTPHLSKSSRSHRVRAVSIGVIPTFKVIFTPLEYVPNLSTYVINICFVLFKQKVMFRKILNQKSGVFLLSSKQILMM